TQSPSPGSGGTSGMGTPGTGGTSVSNPPGGVGAGNATSASGGAANPGAGSGGAVTGTGGAGPGPGASACVPGVPATTQIPRLLNRQYDAVMRDLLGVTAVAANGNQPPSSLLTIDFDGAMNADAWRLYRTAADTIAKEVMSGPNRSKFIACNPADAGCLSETIRAFGRKAFRRPLTDMEVAR